MKHIAEWLYERREHRLKRLEARAYDAVRDIDGFHYFGQQHQMGEAEAAYRALRAAQRVGAELPYIGEKGEDRLEEHLSARKWAEVQEMYATQGEGT